MLYGYVIADIPGLIEGASGGKGLGSKFLRHIARTKLLIHCVSLESEDPIADYRGVRGEIAAFESGALAEKPELVLFTKSDTRDAAYIEKMRKSFTKEFKKETAVVSVLDDAAVEALRQTLVSHLR